MKVIKRVIILFLLVGIVCFIIGNKYANKMTKVTYYTEEGNIIEYTYVKRGSRITKPSDPVKEGFTFDGWVTEDGNKYNFNMVTDAKRINLKESWATYLTVEFLDTDKSKLLDSVNVKYGTKVKEPSKEPTKNNSEFVAWTLNDKEFDFETPIEENTKLIAKWRTYSHYDEEDTFKLTCLLDDKEIEGPVKLNDQFKCTMSFETDSDTYLKEFRFKIKLGKGITLDTKSKTARVENDDYIYKISPISNSYEDEDNFIFNVFNAEKDTELYIRIYDIKFVTFNNNYYYADDIILKYDNK